MRAEAQISETTAVDRHGSFSKVGTKGDSTLRPQQEIKARGAQIKKHHVIA